MRADSDALLACPFCGGKVKWCRCRVGKESRCGRIVCPSCGVEVLWRVFRFAENRRKWNRRANKGEMP